MSADEKTQPELKSSSLDTLKDSVEQVFTEGEIQLKSDEEKLLPKEEFCCDSATD